MENITRFFIKNPILANILIMMNFAAGIYMAMGVPKEGFPKISLNAVEIFTKYPGGSSRDVELNITQKIEDAIDEIAEIKEIRSRSSEGLSRIRVFADDNLSDEQVDDFFDDIDAAVAKIDNFPADMDTLPSLRSVTSRDLPILELAFQGEYDQLKDFIPLIESRLKKVDGVGKTYIQGLPDEEIHIEVDPVKARKKDIDLNSIYKAVSDRNRLGTGGTLETFIGQKKIVSYNKFKNPVDVLETVIRMSPDGNGVKLKEIASIVARPKNDRLLVRNNGKRGASLTINMQDGYDQLVVSDAIIKTVDGIPFPQNVTYKVHNNLSTDTRAKFSLLKNNALMGMVLVISLLVYFFGFKVAFWTAFGIPFTVAGTLIFFRPLDISLNMVSMGAFLMVLGMVVDDAMVISEQYNTNILKGMTPEDAAARSVKKLWRPVLAASLTTITAYLPLLAIGGLPGKFIWNMPVTVALALLISLFDCYFLLPAHLAHRDKGKSKKRKIITFLEKRYRILLGRISRWRYAVLALFIAILATTLYIGKNEVKIESFPQEAATGIRFVITLPKGHGPKKVEEVVMEYEKVILDVIRPNELEGFTVRMGTHATRVHTNIGTEENLISIFTYLTHFGKRSRTAKQIIAQLENEVDKRLSGHKHDTQIEVIRFGPPLGKAFEIIVGSNDDKKRAIKVGEIKDYIQKINGVYDVTDDILMGKDELNIKLDYEKLAQTGLSVSDVLRTLRLAFDGQVVSDLITVGKTYDFRLKMNSISRSDLNVINKLPIANKRGQLINLESIIDFEVIPSLAEIKHFDGVRSTSISGNFDPKTVSAIEILNLVQDKFKSTSDVWITLAGRPVKEANMFEGVKVASMLAVLAIYFILCLMFNSYIRPIIILSVVPFSSVGIILSFWLHDLPLSLFAMISLVGLSGIVINDSIVMVDHVNQELKGKIFSVDILVSGAVTRLRPVLLTTLSTVIGVGPTAYAIGGYDPLLSPLSLALMYGLIFGTLVVLILIPCIYMIGHDLKIQIREFNAKRLVKATTATGLLFLLFTPVIGNGSPMSLKDLTSNTGEHSQVLIAKESIGQSVWDRRALEFMFDPKLTFKYGHLDRTTFPDIGFQADKDILINQYTIGFEQMTKFGFGVGAQINTGKKKLEVESILLGANSSEKYETQYKVKFNVPLWNNFYNEQYFKNKNITNELVGMREVEKDIGQDNVNLKIINAYWNVYFFNVRSQLAKDSYGRALSVHKLNRQKIKLGLTSRSSFLTSEVDVLAKKNAKESSSSKLNESLKSLQRAMEKEAPLAIDEIAFPKKSRPQKLREYLLLSDEQVLETHRQVKRNSFQIKAASFQIDLERMKKKDNINLGIELITEGQDEDFSNSFDEAHATQRKALAVTFDWEFDAGKSKKKAALEQALAEKRKSLHQGKFLEKQAIRKYDELKIKINQLANQLDRLKEIKAKRAKVVAKEKIRFKNGKISTVDIIRQLELYDAVVLQEANTQVNAELALAQFYAEIGKLSEYIDKNDL